MVILGRQVKLLARIIVADDEKNIAMVLEAVLVQDGHIVDKVHDGRAALELMRSGPETPDLVLLDLSMPFMDGKAVVESMRADARLRHIPVVIITGSTLNGQGFPAAESYQALITKPFDLAQVLDCARNLLGRNRTRASSGSGRTQPNDDRIPQVADLF